MTKSAQTELLLDPDNDHLEALHRTAEDETGETKPVDPSPTPAQPPIDYAQFIGRHPVGVTSSDYLSELRDETVES